MKVYNSDHISGFCCGDCNNFQTAQQCCEDIVLYFIKHGAPAPEVYRVRENSKASICPVKSPTQDFWDSREEARELGTANGVRADELIPRSNPDEAAA